MYIIWMSVTGDDWIYRYTYLVVYLQLCCSTYWYKLASVST